MRIYTSYFYQIRFFTPNMIPLSTAMWDPKWYHENQSQSHVYKDKRGILNGMRCLSLVPGPHCSGDCRGDCANPSPNTCDFLKHYREQLDQINFQEFLKELKMLADSTAQIMNIHEDMIICLIVHEAPSNQCSERVVIQEWFKDNNFPINEWSH